MSNPLYTRPSQKRYDYNICMIDTENSVKVLETLLDYGRQGWRFIGWTPNPIKSENIPFLREAILEKELIEL